MCGADISVCRSRQAGKPAPLLTYSPLTLGDKMTAEKEVASAAGATSPHSPLATHHSPSANGEAGLRSLEGLNATVSLPPASAGFWRQLRAFAGPAFLVSVGYMDPGNWGTDLQG